MTPIEQARTGARQPQGSAGMQRLIQTAQAIFADAKGLLAMDESTGTCNLRFAGAGIPQTTEMRRAYRELLLTAPGLGACISGVILYDETIRQQKADGTPFVQVARDAGLLVGIKVDLGAKDLAGHPGEKVTEGLDGLRDRLLAYFEMGARFAKWRGVIAVDGTRLPTDACIVANAHALARYAAQCQEAGLVPIIEPEVLMEGTQTRERCQHVTEAVLRKVFEHLAQQGVVLEATILKPNMVAAGLAREQQDAAADVADATLQCLRRVVPAAVAGIAFLSGGQSGAMASERLNAMQLHTASPPRPGTGSPTPCDRQIPCWPLSYSFGRALQHPALDIWAGKDANRRAAQRALLQRAQCHCAALQGKYSAAMEAQ
jgi:fructose-bisphosphate aldolase class I